MHSRSFEIMTDVQQRIAPKFWNPEAAFITTTEEI
jgi:hypothetical protein